MAANWVSSVAIACALTFGIATTGAFAQTSASDDAKKAKQEAKEAADSTGEAVKDAGKATGKAAKKVAKKTAQVSEDAARETATGTKKAAKTVKRKLTPDTTTAQCEDGTVQTGKTKTTACLDHGGVRK